MIGDPTNFRHLGHIGADQPAVESINSLLSSKGSYEFGVDNVPRHLREKDIPITAATRSYKKRKTSHMKIDDVFFAI
uniref:CRIB domain-containing protein n=1 Tax=Panagrolaimus sp. JU765 TaxID=591449 RepID=A0AC34REL7_9BILA